MRTNMDYMKEAETVDQISDFLFNRLEHCSLDEAVKYFYEEFEMREEVSLHLISDYLLTYRASKTYDLLH